MFLGNVIDLGKRIHAVTKETGHVIKNSLILPRKNSIPNKLHTNSYPFLNQMKTGEFVFTRKKKTPETNAGYFNMPKVHTDRIDVLTLFTYVLLIGYVANVFNSQMVLRLSILLCHWSMSLRNHVRCACVTRAFTCKLTFAAIARRFSYG